LGATLAHGEIFHEDSVLAKCSSFPNLEWKK